MGALGKVLVVDDDTDMLHLIGVRLGAAGYQVSEAESGEEALLSFRKNRPQLVISDLRMGGMDGLALFQNLQLEAPTVPVIILTAHGTIPDAVSATQRGVFSFLTKPFDGRELLRRVEDAIRLSPRLDPEHASTQWRKGLITTSVRMEEVLRQALRISTEGKAAMIVGPTGSGKASVARAIHLAGSRANQAFVTLSCTDLPAQELEEMLSPTGSQSVFRNALGGVLYLEGIGALSLVGQARLFAVLLEKMQAGDPLNRLGQSSAPIDAPDVQVLVSTPRPLDSAVAEGRFRSDLFYLLSKMTLLIPPLSERLEDIPVLAKHFLLEIRPELGLTLAPNALVALQEARWTGNIRQLKNVLEQVAETSLTPVLPEAAIRRVIREQEEGSLTAFDDARREFEREYLIRLLETTMGNVSHAARVAQRNRTEFYKLLARYGLDPAGFKQKFR